MGEKKALPGEGSVGHYAKAKYLVKLVKYKIIKVLQIIFLVYIIILTDVVLTFSYICNLLKFTSL